MVASGLQEIGDIEDMVDRICDILEMTIDVGFNDRGDIDRLYSAIGSSRPLAEFAMVYVYLVCTGHIEDVFGVSGGSLYGRVCGEMLSRTAYELLVSDCEKLIQMCVARPYDICTIQSEGYTATYPRVLHVESKDLIEYGGMYLTRMEDRTKYSRSSSLSMRRAKYAPFMHTMSNDHGLVCTHISKVSDETDFAIMHAQLYDHKTCERLQYNSACYGKTTYLPSVDDIEPVTH